MEGLLAFAALVLSVVAWRRSRGQVALADRVALLEQQIAILRGGRAPEAEGADATARTATAEPVPPEAMPADTLPAAAVPAEVVPRIESSAAPEPASAPAVPGTEPISVSPDEELPGAAEAPAGDGIDWERWLGIRGAAVLGGAVAALAAIFFVREMIERGWLPPELRVALTALAGAACLVASEWRLRERYEVTANGVAGAGIVALYAAFWSARVLYGLIGPLPAFAGMAGVTAACCALAWRHRTLVAAGIGLAGGFLTPLLLSTGSDQPIGLFGYLLLLDVAILFLAQRRGWPILASVALLATLGYQALWIGFRMGPDRTGLGLGIVALFALAFAVSARATSEQERERWLATQAGGVLLPFAFALYFASRAELGPHLWPIALLVGLLVLAAAFVAAVHGRPAIATAASAASLAVVATWLFDRPLDAALAFEAALVAVGLAVVHALPIALARRRDAALEASLLPATLLGWIGLLGLTIAGPDAQPVLSLAPWLAAWVAIAALLVHLGGTPERAYAHALAAGGVAIGIARFALARTRREGTPELATVIAIGLAAALAFQLVALLRRRSAAATWSEHAAGVAALLLLLPLAERHVAAALGTAPFHVAAIGLAWLALLVATRLGVATWHAAATVALAVVLSAWTFQPGVDAAAQARVGLALQLAAVVLLTLWPFIAGVRLLARRETVWASALAAPLLFPSLGTLFERAFGDGAIGLLPVGLAGLALAAAALAQRRFASDAVERRRWLVWQLAVALGFATVAIPVQLEKEWITIGWALEGAALVWLFQRLDHPGLKWAGLALLAGAAVRLLVNPALLDYHVPGAEGASLPVVNWLLYTYLVPAAALFTASRLLAPIELARARPIEASLYAGGAAVAAIGCGVAGGIVVFAWINLTIVDAFSTGRGLVFDLARAPARDLTMSLAWAVYAVALLALGLRRGTRGLRWAALILLVATALKVFLYDLGELRDLYRVASLLGLAVSLLGVSFAYQRFVREDRGGAGR